MRPIKRTSYTNSEYFKYENARVQVTSLPTGEYAIEFEVLSNDTRPRSYHSVKKNKVVVSGIKISKEAALSLIVGLQERLLKDGII